MTPGSQGTILSKTVTKVLAAPRAITYACFAGCTSSDPSVSGFSTPLEAPGDPCVTQCGPTGGVDFGNGCVCY